MDIIVDYSFAHENCFYLTTQSGNKYSVKLDETSPGTNIFVLNFILLRGNPEPKEVFKTLYTMKDILIKHGKENNINSVIAYIDGKDRNEIDKKTRIFCKLVDHPYECTVEENPEIRIQGNPGSYFPDTNFIHIRRISFTEENTKSKKSEKIESENITKKDNSKIKFCFECGLENKGYKFCPGCGTNLQQT